jgi:hypothetical protein
MAFNSKQKGSRHERAVSELIRGYGWEARRMPLSGSIPGLKSDINSPNLPLFLECKNVEGVGKQFLDWFKKTTDNCGSKTPVVVWTKNKEQIYAFLLFTDLLGFVKRAELTGSLINPKLPKPVKLKKNDLSEGLRFSKSNQTGR